MGLTSSADSSAHSDSGLSEYYRQGATWETEIARRNTTSRRVAWTIAALASLIAVGELCALLLALPLKTYEPYMVEVDRSSGFVETKRALQPGALSENEAITMSNIVRYIRARETYDPKALKENFDLAQVLSTGKASTALTELFTPGNRNNPIDVLGRSATITTEISAISFPNKTTALVRFSTNVNKPTETVKQNWQALVRFRYTSTPASNQYRFDNPLGFQVTEYRRDQETVGAEISSAKDANTNSNADVIHKDDNVVVMPAQNAALPDAPQAPPPVVPAPVPAPNEGLIANPPPPPLPVQGGQ